MFTGFSSFKTLISPPTQEWKTQSLYCCTCATLYTHTACVTSLQFPTMSHNISYLKFTGAYVWVCLMGKNSAIVEEQETAETGPTKHRQMTRQEWGGGLTHFVFQFHWAWPPRHRLATHTHTGLRIVVDRGSSWSFFFFERGQDEKAHSSTSCTFVKSCVQPLLDFPLSYYHTSIPLSFIEFSGPSALLKWENYTVVRKEKINTIPAVTWTEKQDWPKFITLITLIWYNFF